MSDIIKPGESTRPHPKQSRRYRFAIPGTRWGNPPISREKLGAPNTVKVKADDNMPPKTMILRRWPCSECGKQFEDYEPHLLCHGCREEIGFMASFTGGLPDGNLPPSVDRTKGVSQPVTHRGVRRKLAEGDTGKE